MNLVSIVEVRSMIVRRTLSKNVQTNTAVTLILAAALSFFTLRGLAKAEGTPRGKEIFERRCGGCHSLDRDKEGPGLRGVYGRAAGSVASFKYSDAIKKAHITWDAESLDKWLSDPDKLIPDNDMGFHLEKADERRDVIAYLKALSGK
jgi:cytochrome c